MAEVESCSLEIAVEGHSFPSELLEVVVEGTLHWDLLSFLLADRRRRGCHGCCSFWRSFGVGIVFGGLGARMVIEEGACLGGFGIGF